jgi:hypothetical protein
VKQFNLNQTINKNGKSTFNSIVEPRVVITKLLVYVKVNIPQAWGDTSFKREFMSMVVDVEKVLKGEQTTFLVRVVSKMMIDSCDRKIQFPLAKVSVFPLQLALH